MVAAPQPPQPKGQSHLGSDHEARERLASTATYPPPVAEPAVRRQTPEVGAVCGKAARTDLCGGRSSNGRPYRNPRKGRRDARAPGTMAAVGRFRYPRLVQVFAPGR